MTDTADTYVTPQRAAELLGIARYTVVRLCDRGELQAIALHTERSVRLVISVASIDAYKARKVSP